MKYVVYPHVSEMMVMTTDEEYAELVLINSALGAATWGEFIDALPDAERQQLFTNHRELFGNDILPENSFDDEATMDPDTLHRSTRFGPESVPGFCEGDYPRWPAEENSITDAICREALSEFGSRQTGFMQTFWMLPPEVIPAVRAWLKVRGHTLAKRPPPEG